MNTPTWDLVPASASRAKRCTLQPSQSAPGNKMDNDPIVPSQERSLVPKEQEEGVSS